MALFAVLVLVAPFDRAIAAWASVAPPGLVAVAQFVTNFGKSGYMFALSAASAVAAFTLARSQANPVRRAQLRGWGKGSLFFFASIAASGLLAQTLKHVVGRVRPAASLLTTGPLTFHPFSLANASASFPSGHTTSAFAAALVLGLLNRRLLAAFLIAACAIGASRVLVGAHYPSDVVAGAALGSVTPLLLARWARRWFYLDYRPVFRADGVRPHSQPDPFAD